MYEKDYREAVSDAYSAVREKYPVYVVASCSIGSMNYGIDTEESDCDVAVIVAPRWEDGVFETKKLQRDYGEITILDARNFIYFLKKPCHTSLEPLFSEYSFISSSFKELWNKLVENRELIAHYDVPKFLITGKGFVTSMRNKARQKDNEKYSEELGMNPKAASHFMRGVFLLKDYICTGSLEKAYKMSPSQRAFVMAIKEGDKEACSKVKEIMDDPDFIKNTLILPQRVILDCADCFFSDIYLDNRTEKLFSGFLKELGKNLF